MKCLYYVILKMQSGASPHDLAPLRLGIPKGDSLKKNTKQEDFRMLGVPLPIPMPYKPKWTKAPADKFVRHIREDKCEQYRMLLE